MIYLIDYERDCIPVPNYDPDFDIDLEYWYNLYNVTPSELERAYKEFLADQQKSGEEQ